MHKNRPFVILLLVLLSLDLLVFFSHLTSSSDGKDNQIEERAEEVVDFFSETEERCEEEESEVFGFGISSQQMIVNCAFRYSDRQFFSPEFKARSVAIGWRMPLLI